MKITNTKISELIFAEYNPRQLKKDQFQQIKDSITRFGIVDPIIVNSNKERKNIIIGGHQRIKVALEMGIEEVPCHFINLTYEKERELNVRLNKNTGEWDWDMLANHFDVDELTEWGFVDDELQFYEPEIGDGLTDDDAIPEDVETTAKPGDLWLLGEHRLLCGDATISTDVDRLMDGDKADMVFTDPPYNVDVVGGCKNPLNKMYQSGKAIKNDKMTNDNFRSFLENAFSMMSAASKDGATAYVCHADSEGINFRCSFADSGWQIKQCIIWKKSAFVFGRQDYHWQHEPILYGWKDGHSHSFYGERNQSTVWDFNRPAPSDKSHPTMKPVELIDKAVTNSSKIEDIILDTFLGSGSTLIACEKTGRKCYGMELDPHYCDVIVKRWEDFTGKKAELAD